MRTAVSTLILPVILASVATQAQTAPWRQLGHATVNRNGWRQVTIPVTRRQNVSAIRLCAEHSRIHFVEARVRFMDNRNQTIRVRSNVAAGVCTRSLWLSGSHRQLSSVRVTTSQPNQRTAWARIRLEGR